MKKKYSNEIATIIKQFLENDGWKFFFDPDEGVFHFGLRIRGKMKTINYSIRVRETDFTAYGISPVHADNEDAECMAKIAEFFNRANFGLLNGNWEIGYDSGELRYKSYIEVEGMTLSAETVRNSIYCIASMFERYSDGILDVIFGGSSAEDAVKKCEHKKLTSNLMDLMDELGIDIENETPESAAEKIAEHLGLPSEEDSQTSPSSESAMETDIKTTLFGEED